MVKMAQLKTTDVTNKKSTINIPLIIDAKTEINAQTKTKRYCPFM